MSNKSSEWDSFGSERKGEGNETLELSPEAGGNAVLGPSRDASPRKGQLLSSSSSPNVQPLGQLMVLVKFQRVVKLRGSAFRTTRNGEHLFVFCLVFFDEEICISIWPAGLGPMRPAWLATCGASSSGAGGARAVSPSGLVSVSTWSLLAVASTTNARVVTPPFFLVTLEVRPVSPGGSSDNIGATFGDPLSWAIGTWVT